MNNPKRRIVTLMAIAIALLMLGMWASPAGARSCLVAQVPQEFALPDGSIHPAGPLRICNDIRLNPVVELQEISVSGSVVGLFQGKTFETEEQEIVRPLLYFLQTDGEELVLVAMAQPSPHRGGRPTTLLFADGLGNAGEVAGRPRTGPRTARKGQGDSRKKSTRATQPVGFASLTSQTKSIIVVAAR